jgi:hypothetical protein
MIHHADLGRRRAVGNRRRFDPGDNSPSAALEMSATRRPRLRLPGWAWPVIITATLTLTAWGAVRGIPDPVADSGALVIYAGCGAAVEDSK